MSWHLLEKLLDEVSKQSTFVGKVWITLLFVFRIVAITRIADTVYADEQAAFKCNTKQPGCENVCFNDFSPISHVRFWGFQVIIVATPSMIFIVYALHVVSKLPRIFRLSGRQVEVATFKNKKKGHSFPPKLHTTSTGKIPHQIPDDHAVTAASSKTQPRRNEYETCAQRRLLGGHTADVISFGDYPTVIGDSDCESPPAYNHHANFYYEEIQVGNVLPSFQNVRIQTSYDDLYSTKDTFSRATQKSFSPLSEISRAFPKRRVRRHSDSDLTPARRRRGSFKTHFGSSCDLTSYDDDVTKRRYTVAKEFSLNDIWRGCNNCRGRDPGVAVTPRSDKDSAFSESGASSERCYVFKPSPPPTTAIERCSSAHTQRSARFQRKVLGREDAPEAPIPHFDAKNRFLVDSKRTAALPSGCSGRIFTPSRASSGHKSVRARAVIKRLEDHIAVGYLVQCVVRLLLETAFLVLQYLMFDFEVPELYKCQRWPCPHVVDCFVSRPQEKSTLLYFMFGVSALCIALTWHEIVTLSWRIFRESRDQRLKAKLTGVGSLAALSHTEHKEKKTKSSPNDIYLLDRYAKYIQARNGDFEVASSSDSKTHSSSSSDSDMTAEQESFNSEDLSSMFDNDNIDVGDFTEAAAAGEGGEDCV